MGSQSLVNLCCDQTSFGFTDQDFKMSTAAAAPKAKKAAKPKAPATHPTFKVMTSAAIAALKDKKGSSRQAIIKYVVANYNLAGKDTKKVGSLVKAALQRGLADGTFKNSKGKGVTGSIKLADKPKSPKKTAKKATKKAAADKPKKPKSPKKKAAKLKAKSPTKKAAAKKPKAAKKPAGEKKPKAPKSPVKKAKPAAAKKPKAAAKKSPAKKTKAAAKKIVMNLFFSPHA